MSKFESKKIMPRYTFITILMTMVAIAVIGKTLYIMSATIGWPWPTARRKTA